MAAMRARRPTRGGADNSGRGRQSNRKPAPASRDPMPRLAAIKLEGIGASDVGVTKKNFATMAVGGLMFMGAAIAGATWIGGSLFDAGQAFERSADSVAAGVGFRIDDIQVAGVSDARADEIARTDHAGRAPFLARDRSARGEGADRKPRLDCRTHRCAACGHRRCRSKWSAVKPSRCGRKTAKSP